MAFENIAITDAGKELLATSQVDSFPVHVYSVEIGNGMLSGSEASKTSLVNTLYSVEPVVSRNGQELVIEFDLPVQEESYYFRELGIFFADNENRPVLYGYANAGSDAELITSFDNVHHEKRIKLMFIISSDLQVDLSIEPSIYATKEYVDKKTNVSDWIDLFLPIGSIITNSLSAFNPNNLYEGTTWVRIKGRVIIGVDENDSDFSLSGKIGGEKSHVLNTGEIPTHNHSATTTIATNGAHTHSVGGTAASSGAHQHAVFIGSASVTFGAGGGSAVATNANTHNTSSNGAHTHSVSGTATSAGAHAHTATTSIGQVGGGTGHNNMQPYITKYVWERIA